MITLLKFGGSLITDKDTPHTVQLELLQCLCEELASIWLKNPFHLIIGHGSGSFGHVPAKKNQTKNGVSTPKQWQGFAEVHSEATALNRIVIDSLRCAGLPAISFVPMDSVRGTRGKICQWDLSYLLSVLNNGLIPVIFGDAVFDETLGGTIFSTEDLFEYLCEQIEDEKRILIAGREEGVWLDYPYNTRLQKQIFIKDEQKNEKYLQGSGSVDVTGGMREKVRLMKKIIQSGNAEEARIFSGKKVGNLTAALFGEEIGTQII